jgi:hypothetical protein
VHLYIRREFGFRNKPFPNWEPSHLTLLNFLRSTRRSLLSHGFQDHTDLFEQSFVAGRSVQNIHGSQLDPSRPGLLVRTRNDEDNRNVTASRNQMTLETKPTHTWQVQIDDKARGAADLAGDNKFLCRWED